MSGSALTAGADPQAAQPEASRAVSWALGLSVVALAAWFRLPPLLNAGAVNSDAAVPGLQALRLLEGEWSWFLWGTHYQGSIEPLLLAPAFAVFGARPGVLIGLPYTGALVMVALAFDVLRRRVGPWSAAWCLLPLVFVSHAATSPLIYVMRQVLATTLVLALWVAETGPMPHPSAKRLAVATGLFAFCAWIDVFFLVCVPAVAVYLGWHLWSLRREGTPLFPVARTLGLGLVVGLIPFIVARVVGGKPPQQAGITFERLSHNAALLWDVCLPFALGLRAYVYEGGADRVPWQGPAPWNWVMSAAAVLFALLVASSGVLFIARRVPEATRRLGLLGAVTAASTFGAFLLSTMPVDLWSVRYLAPLFWLAPFALAPVAALLGPRKLGVLLMPYVATAAFTGWLNWSPHTDGPLPRVVAYSNGEAEAELLRVLKAEGVEAGAAQYWTAYRLTFLFDQQVWVVPLDAHQDCFRRYRGRYDAAKTVALIFHPSERRATPEATADAMQRQGVAFQRREVAGYTVLLVQRAPR